MASYKKKETRDRVGSAAKGRRDRGYADEEERGFGKSHARKEDLILHITHASNGIRTAGSISLDARSPFLSSGKFRAVALPLDWRSSKCSVTDNAIGCVRVARA